MATFILSIGILGVSMMQLMALRSTRGAQSLNMAVTIANRILDSAEAEARQAWLTRTQTTLDDASATAQATLQLASNKYLKGQAHQFQQGFSPTGTPVPVAQAFYTTKTTQTAPVTGTTGAHSVLSVEVSFVETVVAAGSPVRRKITLQRTVHHA